MPNIREEYDVVVVGAGHAGCEAALAAARMGLETIIFTVSVESIAMMPCNPNIGGSSKGHLVREIDALGGEMGKNIDATFIQSKMLNASKGPAVHSLRAQADKSDYSRRMRNVLENTEHLHIRQAEVSEIIVNDGKIGGVKTVSGAEYIAKAVVLCTGVYLKARCIYGDVSYHTGPNGLQAANHLTQSLIDNGIEVRRFKTGTPGRVDKRSVDFSKMTEQFGDKRVVPFSFETDPESIQKEQVSCWLTYTNEETHKIIMDNLDRSPLYSGDIHGTGPRYCPSIEDKVVRFADKDRHQVFIEPEGLYTNEMYLGGMSSSMPEDVQYAMYRTVPGLENVRIVRNAYAIEYDCINAVQLKSSLEFKKIEGLFAGGQFNGSSGYEEAAAQGIVAGINAVLFVKKEEPLILDRSESYIGVLIDDLVTKGVDEPYRMFNSRAEYRILLRQDDADMRLTEKSYELGLAKRDRYDLLKEKREQRDKLINFAKEYSIKPSYINGKLEALGTTPLKQGVKLIDLILRPQLNMIILAELIPALKREIETIPNRKEEIVEAAEIMIKYQGYIEREKMIADKISRLEHMKIKGRFNYHEIQALSTEARQKLSKIEPETIAQASRIPGISPSDINILLLLLGR